MYSIKLIRACGGTLAAPSKPFASAIHTTLHYCCNNTFSLLYVYSLQFRPSPPCRIRKRSSTLPSLSNAPTVGDTASEAQADKPVAVQADITNNSDDDDNYDGRGERTPQLF
jgi:hypothetical protein